MTPRGLFSCVTRTTPQVKRCVEMSLTEFIDAVPSDVIVVLDEAYREFISDIDVPDGLDFFRERNNVVVMRTFSSIRTRRASRGLSRLLPS